MQAIIQWVLAFLATASGKATVASMAIYVFSLFGDSTWYKKLREAVGRACEAAGAALSALGSSKLKFLWNPTEKVLCDFLFFAVEQFAVGLRKDNPEKMARQLDRLESVGSQSRAEALAVKLEALGAPVAPPANKSDAEVLAQAVAAGDAGQQQRLQQ